MIEFKPIIVKNEIILYDIYIDGVWHGSKRTIEQCEQYVRRKNNAGLDSNI